MNKVLPLNKFFDKFVRTEAFSGVLLFVAAVIGFGWANSAWGQTYFDLKHLKWGIPVIGLSQDLEHWVNDGLMTLFFLMVGLEIKREVTVGELANPRNALLTIFAALGGMLVPALIYTAFNIGTPGSSGWGIPMATDIAFALGVLALLGSKVPLSLKVFLTAVAIVDDLGAILVIALFYTSSLDFTALALATACWGIALALGRMGVKHLWLYLLIGLLMWYFTLESGLHATIAGVLLAFTLPLNPEDRPDDDIELVDSPLHRLEHSLHPFVSYGILPLFALVNAGVALKTGSSVGSISLGIMVGLVLGKPLGVLLSSYLAVKLKIADLPPGVSWPALLGVGCLAGIGFTMALFIANLAFPAGELQNQAKAGILMASLLAGLLGTIILAREYRT